MQTYQSKSYKCIVKGSSKLPLRSSLMWFPLLNENLNHLVIILRYPILLFQVLPQLNQTFLDLLIVRSLKSVKDGSTN